MEKKQEINDTKNIEINTLKWYIDTKSVRRGAASEENAALFYTKQ